VDSGSLNWITNFKEGGIEAFLQRDVLPHAPGAWYGGDSAKTGYILALEEEAEELLSEIVGESR
jgi:type I restriction enzyme M protein